MKRRTRGHLGRLAAALMLVVYWVLLAVGSQFVLHPPSALYDLWYSAAPAVVGIGFAFVVGLYVAQWWVLLVAFTPVAALGTLELAAHRSPWHDSGPPLTQYGWAHVAWWSWWFFVMPLLLGVAAGRGRGRGRTSLHLAAKT